MRSACYLVLVSGTGQPPDTTTKGVRNACDRPEYAGLWRCLVSLVLVDGLALLDGFQTPIWIKPLDTWIRGYLQNKASAPVLWVAIADPDTGEPREVAVPNNDRVSVTDPTPGGVL